MSDLCCRIPVAMKIIIDSHIPHIHGLIEPRAEVLYMEPQDITAAAVRDADALIVRTRTRCDASLLEGSRVRFIGSATIGTDHIDLDYCAANDITVRNAPGCNAPAVAQWVFCAIHAWMRARSIITAEGLTLGVVGVGHIGSIVVRWGRELGFNVLLNDPPLCHQKNRPFDDICELQRRCDIITFHTPLSRDGQWPTWHLCDQAFLDGLDHCRLILNAARGPVVDNSALLHWNGDLGLDCWENEPKVSRGLLEKCIVATPHIAGYSREGKQRGTAMMLEALNEFYGWNITVPTIDSPATGATQVTLEGISASYDIMADTARLKGNPDAFESLRNHYPHREEFKP